MDRNQRLLDALIEVNSISNDENIGFEHKFRRILSEVVNCMQAESGSIMLVKGRKNLEVIASTNEELIGIKEPLEEKTPSRWVVQNRVPLYVDSKDNRVGFQKRFHHYRGASFLLAPIINNKKVIGVLSVTDKVGEDIFSKKEQNDFLNLAAQIISALENQRLTDALNQRKRTLQRKNLELKRLEKLKTDLFNMLIHDLKGPISELIANLDILSYTVSDKNQEYVESAKTGCDTLYTMVSNLLDVVRLEEGRLRLLHEVIDPHDLIKEALSRLFWLGRMKDLNFVEKIPSHRPKDPFWGDRGILLRVLQNLFTNAINYSPAGETIEVGVNYPGHQKIEFFVNDNGPGVPPEQREAIFDKFFQLEKKGDGRIYTTGLGLTFCKMAVEAHGGKIRVECEGLKGSRFIFSLPLNIRRSD